MKLKLKTSMNILVKIQKCLIFSNYSAKSKYYDDSNKLVVGKLKGVAIKEFVGLNSKIYSFLVGDNSAKKEKQRV